MIRHPAKVRFTSTDEDSAIEATIQEDGAFIRVIVDADSIHGHVTWLRPAQVRELAIELAGLADAADAIRPGADCCGPAEWGASLASGEV